MSPSRLSAGITSGSPVDESRSANVASISCGSYGTSGMALRGGVHLLLEHSLVGRADGVLRAAEDLGARALGLAEGELGDGVADAALDPLGAERDLVVALALAPLLRAVGVADGHAHDRDRRVDAAERRDARDAAAGADDHLAADLLAEDAVRRADVAAALRRDRRGLQAEPVLADRRGGLVHDPVVGRATRSRARGRSAGTSSSTPITSGASTRRLSSRSSCPVSSPSRTTIVCSSRIALDGNRVEHDEWDGAGRVARARFATTTAGASEISDEGKLARIEALAIPPAWKDVWISPRSTREAAGDRNRRRRPEAVPVQRRTIEPSRSGRSTTS